MPLGSKTRVPVWVEIWLRLFGLFVFSSSPTTFFAAFSADSAIKFGTVSGRGFFAPGPARLGNSHLAAIDIVIPRHKTKANPL